VSGRALAAMAQADLSPMGAVEQVFAIGADLPGYPGAVFYRKFKRRLQRRAEARFAELSRALGPGDIALDFGANMGDLMALLAANGSSVHAYEPEPETFALLSARFADAANIHLHQAAVFDREGTAELILPASFREKPRSASKAASIAHDRYLGPGHIAHSVRMRDIRAILRALPKPPVLIKMDIEGAELAVLEAMRQDGLVGPEMAIFVETHERLDPASLPRVRALQNWARSEAAGYVNLHWG